MAGDRGSFGQPHMAGERGASGHPGPERGNSSANCGGVVDPDGRRMHDQPCQTVTICHSLILRPI